MTAKDNSTLHVTVWLDRHSAVMGIEERSIAFPDDPPKKTIERFTSNIERRCSSTGGRHGHMAFQHLTVQPAIKAERRREHESIAFMREIIAHIEKNPQHRIITSLQIYGPGEAKKMLASQIKLRHPEWPTPELSATGSRLTEAQKLAHFESTHRKDMENRKNRTSETAARRFKA